MLTPTKYWCRQKLGIDKTSASAKSRHQQNHGVDKTSALTKCWCLLLFWPGKVCSSWLLPDLADALLPEGVVLSTCSCPVTGLHGRTAPRIVPLGCIGQPGCTGLSCYKSSKYWRQQNIGTSLLMTMAVGNGNRSWGRGDP
jgi:hypothetical protein